jgi:hypothetical protein
VRSFSPYYLGCEAFFSLISHTAGGYSFYKDARLRRITRYRYNNVPVGYHGEVQRVKLTNHSGRKRSFSLFSLVECQSRNSFAHGWSPVASHHLKVELAAFWEQRLSGFRLERIREEFPRFWEVIGTEGDLERALGILMTSHNRSKTGPFSGFRHEVEYQLMRFRRRMF